MLPREKMYRDLSSTEELLSNLLNHFLTTKLVTAICFSFPILATGHNGPSQTNVSSKSENTGRGMNEFKDSLS